MNILFFFLISVCSLKGTQQVTVMTLNIRQDTKSDTHLKEWSNRRALVGATIGKASIVGIQEARANQIKDIAQLCPNYLWTGVGRDDGKSGGEHCPIFYDRRQWSKIDGGTFWLSSSPNKPGSKGWGSSYPRICTWARLRGAQGAAIYVYNTHFDHLSNASRIESAKLIIQAIKERKYIDEPLLLLGDFNARYTSTPIQTITTAKGLRGTLLYDSYLSSKPSEKDPATFNRWDPDFTAQGKIDYIFHSPCLQLKKTSILRVFEGKTVVSDHWPQVATFLWDPLTQNQRIAWRFFKESAIDKEMGEGKGWIIRWADTVIPVRLVRGTSQQKEQLVKVVNELNSALKPTGVTLKYTTEPSKKEISCFLGSYRDLQEVCRNENLSPPQDYAGFASLNWIIQTKVVIKAKVLIATDRIEESQTYHVLLEELTQCLGLVGDNSVFPESVTFSRGTNHGDAPKLGPMDVNSIRLLYKHLNPGDSEQKTKQIFNEKWGKPY